VKGGGGTAKRSGRIGVIGKTYPRKREFRSPQFIYEKHSEQFMRSWGGSICVKKKTIPKHRRNVDYRPRERTHKELGGGGGGSISGREYTSGTTFLSG